MSMYIAALLAATSLCADAGGGTHASLEGAWRGTRLNAGLYAFAVGDNLTFRDKDRVFTFGFRVNSGEIDLTDNERVARGLYLIEGDTLTLLFAAGLGNERPTDLRTKISEWEKLTESALLRLKKGESTDSLMLEMPGWYFTILFFERVSPSDSPACQ